MGTIDDLRARANGVIGQVGSTIRGVSNSESDTPTGADTEPGTGDFEPSGDAPRRRGRPPGSGSRNTGTTGSSSVRAENDAETQYLVDDAPPKAPRGRRPKATDIVTADDVAKHIKLGMDMLAMMRGPHWSKTQSEIMPVAIPLAQYLNTLPVSMRKKAEAYILPITLAMGAFTVFGEPIKYEFEIAKFQLSSRKPAVNQGDKSRVNDPRQGQNSVPPSARNGHSTTEYSPSIGQPWFPTSGD